jgi:ABC-type multidrug transport system permease subunit
MSGRLAVARAVARRSLLHAFTNPALLVPSIVFPLVFLVGFAGGLSAVGDVPGFDFNGNYTAFQFVFVFLQSAAFGGVFTGFGIAADFESGFARRMLLAAPHRSGMLLGYVAAGMTRWALTGVIVTVASLLAGMDVNGGGVELAGLVGVGLLVNVTATLFGAGVSLRAKTLQAGPLMQIPIFVGLFLAPVYVPLGLLTGWIHAVASYNPVTALLQSGRGFISGAPDQSALAFACGAALAALMALYAVRGLRRAERGA